jgi:transposase InsO family protein
MDSICAQFDISRQAHYQKLQREVLAAAQGELILELVRQIRRQHPKMGARKLLHKLQPMLAAEGLKIGRDGLLDLLRGADLLVKGKKKPRRTTIPGYWRAPNLLPGRVIACPNQVWVCDITYLELEKDGFAYLFLLMDLYSRYILGWQVSPSLAAEGALGSLQRALPYLEGSACRPIHHSDHGVQYTSRNYMATLQANGLQASMGAVGNCYDNIFAERVINTLKNEYWLGDRFVDLEQVQQLVSEVIHLYNSDRPHLALNMAVPEQVFFGKTRNVKEIAIPSVEARTPDS